MTLSSVTRYDADRLSRVGDRAVVVGGSMAGLCAARVLADGFDEVVVLERDEFPDHPTARDGAPQTSHPHAMLEAGRVTLEDFFPGFGEDLMAKGGLMLDAGTEVTWYDQGGTAANPDEWLPMYFASRAMFEHVVREHVREMEIITLRGDCHFIEYSFARGTVTGVVFRAEDGDKTRLAADLVVDATGRTSRTPQWLEDQGYPTPSVDEVEVGVTYSTIRIDRPPESRRAFFVAPEADRPRGAAVLPIEGDQWEVILQGVNGERAPTNRETFLEWADGYPVNDVGQLVRDRDWISDGIHHYPFPSSVRRHYEELDRFPDGLVVTGDAIASFNPIYGQGMSVAALDALMLHHELPDGGTEDLAPRFFDRVAPIIDDVWKLAVGNDFIFEGTTGPKPTGTDLFNKYVARLVKRAQDDPVLTEAFFRVFRLERSVATLLHPSIVWRVFRPRFGSGESATGQIEGPSASRSEPARETSAD